MSFAGPRHLLSHREDDSTIFSIKNLGVSLAKQENILEKLVFMGTFEEISSWVSEHSHGENFIANPVSAGDADLLDCLFAIQEPLALALRPIEKRRKNGRDVRLLEAAKTGDYTVIADILASAAWTYWQNHNFQISQDVHINISAVCQFQNDEKNQQKKDFQKAQLDHIGAAIEFTKARKKGAFQEIFDFEETEEILKNNDFEV